MAKVYAGIDLHSSNNYIGVIDENDRRLFQKRLPNDREIILKTLEPFRDNLVGIAIESTFNRYWIVDFLIENQFRVHLANPSATRQYEGLKYTDDPYDAYWLAHMLRLNILPTGYIYPKEERDLLRRRLFFVQQRMSQILSFQSMITRNLGKRYSVNRIKSMTENDVEELFDHGCLVMAGKCSISTIRSMTNEIKIMEKEMQGRAKPRPEFSFPTTIPGIGKIPACTIMPEVGDIGRFEKVGNHSSYCRCVRSERISNEKSTGQRRLG